MAMEAGEIERLIKEALPDATVEIRDLAGDGDHYAATVVSPSFKGKSRVQQHQIVYSALKGRWAACSTRSLCRPRLSERRGVMVVVAPVLSAATTTPPTT